MSCSYCTHNLPHCFPLDSIRILARVHNGSLLSAGNLAQLQETAAALEAAGSPSELALPGRLMPLHPDDVEELRIEDIALTCSRCCRAWLKSLLVHAHALNMHSDQVLYGSDASSCMA